MKKQESLRRRVAGAFVAIVTGVAASGLHAQSCTPTWQNSYAFPGINGQVRTSAVFDDGSGPALFIGGNFIIAGSTEVVSLAKWNGTTWIAASPGVYANDAGPIPSNPNRTPGYVYAMAAHAGKLYIGGQFRRVGSVVTNSIAVGTPSGGSITWGAMTNGSVVGFPKGVDEDTQVTALASGPDGLYIGGVFTSTTSANIAKATGSVIQSVPGFGTGGGSAANYGTGGLVTSIASYDDGLGGGPKVYVGGIFTDMNGVSDTHGLARLVPASSEWESVQCTYALVSTFGVFDDDGAGPHRPELYIAGTALQLNGLGSGGTAGTPDSGVAKWDGLNWAAVGTAPYNLVSSFAVHTDSTGSHLYASVGGSSTLVRKLTDSAWSDVPGAFSLHSNGHLADQPGATIVASYGGELFVGGRFDAVNNVPAASIAKLSSTGWSSVPATKGPVTVPEWPNSGGVEQLVTVDPDGAGSQPSAIYALGQFESIGGVVAKHIAKFDGNTWSALGAGLGVTGDLDYPISVVSFDAGDGATLYAAAKSDPLGVLHKWNGSTWTTIPGNAFVDSSDPLVATSEGLLQGAVVFDDDGPIGPNPSMLYVVGYFNTINGMPASNIAKWDGTTWSAVGPQVFDGSINAVTVHDGKLIVAGTFTHIDSDSVGYIAAWDGSSWSSLGSGVNAGVKAVASFGGSLYVGGGFTAPSVGIARWNGSAWSDIGGVSAPFVKIVNALTTGNDGRGPSLFVGGQFDTAGPAAAKGIARWDGTSWSTLAEGVTSGTAGRGGNVLAMTTLGNLVVAAGSFSHVGTQNAATLAMWGCPPATCVADFNNSGAVTVADIFDYLNAWFASDPHADIDGVGGPTVQDLFAFLNAWFAGC